jgi:hypothetical protein
MDTGTKGSVQKLCLSVFWFAVHSLAAVPLAAVISVLSVGFLAGAIPYRTLGDVLAWLLTFAIGCSLGFFVNRDLRQIVPCLVWISGLTWLALGIHGSVRDYDPRWYQGCTAAENVVNAFFVDDSSKCGGGESTLATLFFTMPALSSVAYSVGAWIALRGRRDKGVVPPVHLA